MRQTVPTEIFVGDAGSCDGTSDMLAARYPSVVICRGTSDLWWTGATNLALREALRRCGERDYILCLNDDTVVGAEYIEHLLEAVSGNTRQIVGSVAVTVENPDMIVDGGHWMNWTSAALRSFNAGKTLSNFPKGYRRPVNVLPGRGTLVPASAFREVGIFAEKLLPHYAADYEFAARCDRAGYELLVVYDAVVYSHTDLTGIHFPANKMSLNETFRFFGSRRSSCNIKDRFFLAWLTRRNSVQFLSFFSFSLMRIIYHYLCTHCGTKARGEGSVVYRLKGNQFSDAAD